LVLDAGMIPFVAQYIDQVDLQARRIDVDWNPEWWQ
jgi:ribosomal 30S subunit maturation factor RimM